MHVRAVILVAALLALCAGCDRDPSDGGGTGEEAAGAAAEAMPRADRRTPVRAWQVRSASLPRVVLATGTVEPRERVRVAARLSGSLVALTVAEGDAVTRGQVLAEVDTVEMRAELRRAQAEEALLAGRVERLEELVVRGAAPPVELADLRAQRDVAAAQVSLWRARLELARVRSPLDGVVLRRMVDPGSTVRADEELLEIADLEDLVVRVRFSERDVVHLAEGARASVVLDAFPGARLGATVRRIFPSVDPGDRLMTVELALGEPPPGVHPRPGFMARIGISLDERPMRIVPAEALLASTRGERFVYVIADDRLVRRDVEVGVERRNWVEIRGGLEEGETVVGMNPATLREGTAVRVTAEVEPPALAASDAAAMRRHGLEAEPASDEGAGTAEPAP